MIIADKKSLRIKYSSIRNSITDKAVLSSCICNRLIDSDIYKRADTVLLYWSVGSEVATLSLIDKALSDGKKLALPKCLDSDGNMLFYYVSSADALQDGMYGIKEPPTDKFADHFSDSSVCVVPGLCFSKDGYRLGYGKGYYDRFLGNFCGISVGICYDECLTDILPINGYDKKVNYIITDKTIHKIK